MRDEVRLKKEEEDTNRPVINGIPTAFEAMQHRGEKDTTENLEVNRDSKSKYAVAQLEIILSEAFPTAKIEINDEQFQIFCEYVIHECMNKWFVGGRIGKTVRNRLEAKNKCMIGENYAGSKTKCNFTSGNAQRKANDRTCGQGLL
jgi:hypothetical protein